MHPTEQNQTLLATEWCGLFHFNATSSQCAFVQAPSIGPFIAILLTNLGILLIAPSRISDPIRGRIKRWVKLSQSLLQSGSVIASSVNFYQKKFSQIEYSCYEFNRNLTNWASPDCYNSEVRNRSLACAVSSYNGSGTPVYGMVASLADDFVKCFGNSTNAIKEISLAPFPELAVALFAISLTTASLHFTRTVFERPIKRAEDEEENRLILNNGDNPLDADGVPYPPEEERKYITECNLGAFRISKCFSGIYLIEMISALFLFGISCYLISLYTTGPLNPSHYKNFEQETYCDCITKSQIIPSSLLRCGGADLYLNCFGE